VTLELGPYVEPGVPADVVPEISRPSFAWIPRDAVLVTELMAPLLVAPASWLVTGELVSSVVVFAVALFGLLTSWRLSHHQMGSRVNSTGTLFRRVWLSYAVASAFTVITNEGDMQTLLVVAVATVPYLMIAHSALRALERMKRLRQPKKRTLVVGGGVIARRAISILADHKEYGLQVVGVVDDDAKFAPAELGATLLGGLSDLPDVVRRMKAEVVVVAYSSGDQKCLVGALRDAMAEGASVWVVPRLFELGWKGSSGEHLWGLPVMYLRSPALFRPQWALKRVFDLVLTGVGVLVLSPLLLLISAAVYLDLGRPVLHRQRRITRAGQPFELLKFRTMRVAEHSVESTEWAADEARITRLGGFLRAYSLDELPQLLNILRGEMSLVGPRPERPHFVNVFSDLYPEYSSRHRLPAGLTGWAQIHGLRGDTSIEERTAFDNYYIENWSLSKDLRILVRTVFACLRWK
jgi:exopolysaccharide biosynthesis polyprenyl glycosylphosphotransferase